jgi:hypothetical protein
VDIPGRGLPERQDVVTAVSVEVPDRGNPLWLLYARLIVAAPALPVNASVADRSAPTVNAAHSAPFRR